MVWRAAHPRDPVESVNRLFKGGKIGHYDPRHPPPPMKPPDLEPLKRKLLKAAEELLSRVGSGEFNSFEAVADGRRMVVEIAMLPPPTPTCRGAQRATPPSGDRPGSYREGIADTASGSEPGSS